MDKISNFIHNQGLINHKSKPLVQELPKNANTKCMAKD